MNRTIAIPPHYIFFSYFESYAVLEYAGHFIGLRSGFCDVISGAKCNKVILYPTKPVEFDGQVHRADAEFSSLQNMELAKDALELTAPFARDITNLAPDNENIQQKILEDQEFIDSLMKRFPKLD